MHSVLSSVSFLTVLFLCICLSVMLETITVIYSLKSEWNDFTCVILTKIVTPSIKNSLNRRNFCISVDNIMYDVYSRSHKF